MANKISPGMYGFFAILIVVLVGGFYSVSQTQVGPTYETPQEAAAAACALDTTLTINAVNALAKGTAVTSPSHFVIVNDEVSKAFTSGTTKLSPGDKIQLLTTATNYIDSTDSIIVKCGENSMVTELYATDDVAAVEIFNDDNDKMTDAIAGGAVNQTNLGAGEALTVSVKFKGTNEQSTGDLIYIVEAGVAANVTDITMSGNAEKLTSIPSVHTTQVAGSKVVAFRIPAVIGATTQTYDLTFTVGTTKDLSGGVYTDVYSEQAFVDDNGLYVVGVQDASGDAKYEDTSDSDFFVEAA